MDAPADRNGFLHAYRFALLFLVPTVAAKQTDVVIFLTTARMNIIFDGCTLDEICGKMADPVTAGRLRSSSSKYYESWSEFIAEMERSDKYVDTLFMHEFSGFYIFSVDIISNIYDESQVNYLGSSEPTDSITVCFPTSEEHS